MTEAGFAAFTLNHLFVGVRTPDADTARALERLLPSYAVEPPRPFAGSVQRLDYRDGEWVVTPATGEEARFANLLDAYDELEYIVSMELLGSIPDFVHVHASGVATESGAVIALGESGAGKSSLAVHWSMSGRPVFGDDVILIDEAARVHAFKRLFGLRRAHLAEYGWPTPSELEAFAEADSEEAWFDPTLGAGWARPASVVKIALVRFEKGRSLSITPLSKPEMLAALSVSLLQTGLGAAGAFDRLVQLCDSAVTVRVSFGDSREAAEAITAVP